MILLKNSGKKSVKKLQQGGGVPATGPTPNRVSYTVRDAKQAVPDLSGLFVPKSDVSGEAKRSRSASATQDKKDATANSAFIGKISNGMLNPEVDIFRGKYEDITAEMDQGIRQYGAEIWNSSARGIENAKARNTLLFDAEKSRNRFDRYTKNATLANEKGDQLFTNGSGEYLVRNNTTGAMEFVPPQNLKGNAVDANGVELTTAVNKGDGVIDEEAYPQYTPFTNSNVINRANTDRAFYDNINQADNIINELGQTPAYNDALTDLGELLDAKGFKVVDDEIVQVDGNGNETYRQSKKAIYKSQDTKTNGWLTNEPMPVIDEETGLPKKKENGEVIMENVQQGYGIEAALHTALKMSPSNPIFKSLLSEQMKTSNSYAQAIQKVEGIILDTFRSKFQISSGNPSDSSNPSNSSNSSGGLTGSATLVSSLVGVALTGEHERRDVDLNFRSEEEKKKRADNPLNYVTTDVYRDPINTQNITQEIHAQAEKSKKGLLGLTSEGYSNLEGGFNLNNSAYKNRADVSQAKSVQGDKINPDYFVVDKNKTLEITMMPMVTDEVNGGLRALNEDDENYKIIVKYQKEIQAVEDKKAQDQKAGVVGAGKKDKAPTAAYLRNMDKKVDAIKAKEEYQGIKVTFQKNFIMQGHYLYGTDWDAENRSWGPTREGNWVWAARMHSQHMNNDGDDLLRNGKPLSHYQDGSDENYMEANTTKDGFDTDGTLATGDFSPLTSDSNIYPMTILVPVHSAKVLNTLNGGDTYVHKQLQSAGELFAVEMNKTTKTLDELVSFSSILTDEERRGTVVDGIVYTNAQDVNAALARKAAGQ